MGKVVVKEVIGKHLVYEVVRNSTFWGTSYYVRMSNGKFSDSFSGLDRAVQWAVERAQRR